MSQHVVLFMRWDDFESGDGKIYMHTESEEVVSRLGAQVATDGRKYKIHTRVTVVLDALSAMGFELAGGFGVSQGRLAVNHVDGHCVWNLTRRYAAAGNGSTRDAKAAEAGEAPNGTYGAVFSNTYN